MPRSAGKRPPCCAGGLVFGTGAGSENLETLFDAPDGLCPDASIGVEAPDLEAVRSSRKDSSDRLFGPNVLELCALSDIVFLGLHGQTVRTAGSRPPLTCWEFVIPAAGIWPRDWPWHQGDDQADDGQRRNPDAQVEAAGIRTGGCGPSGRGTAHALCHQDRHGGSSLGVFLPEDRAALRSALEQVLGYHGKVLWEERIYGRGS